MKTTTIALVLALLTGPVFAAEAALRNLFEQEKAGLDSVSDDRLRRLVTPPGADREIRVAFTRDWVDRLPKARGGAEWRCLAEALYFEARGETVKGQFAVAEVILNRVESTRFPDDICGVVNQGTGKKYQCQFTYTCDGHAERIAEPRAFERVAKVARAAIDGMAGEITGGATHYHTTAVRPKWSQVYTKTAAIGVHVFYRHNYRTASN